MSGTADGLVVFEGPADLAVLNARLPALFFADAKSSERFWELFAANIRNKNTRRAYYKAVCSFSDWCEGRGLFDLSKIMPIHVAAYVEDLQRTHSKPTVKQHLAAHAVRLAGSGSYHGRESGACGAWPQACREERQDAGALGGRSPHSVGQH
jgi:hypothetical protein